MRQHTVPTLNITVILISAVFDIANSDHRLLTVSGKWHYFIICKLRRNDFVLWVLVFLENLVFLVFLKMRSEDLRCSFVIYGCGNRGSYLLLFQSTTTLKDPNIFYGYEGVWLFEGHNNFSLKKNKCMRFKNFYYK